MKKKLYEDFESTGKTNAIKKRVNELINKNKSMVILDTKKEYEELFKNTNYEIIKLDISEFYRKLEYLRNKYNTKEVESEHKLGFVAINCVFLSLTVILIFTLIYILFKYFN